MRALAEEEQWLHEAHEAGQVRVLGPSHWGPGEMQCPLGDEDLEGKGSPKGKGHPKGKAPEGKGRSGLSTPSDSKSEWSQLRPRKHVNLNGPDGAPRAILNLSGPN